MMRRGGSERAAAPRIAAARKAAAEGAATPPKSARRAKLFVLDTNVLLHDPMCLFRFEEHDIFLPMIVLEELDGHKKGMTEVARNARQTSRTLDALAGRTRGRHRHRPEAGHHGATAKPAASCSSRPSRWHYTCP
jgi:PhoH-like ATPase